MIFSMSVVRTYDIHTFFFFFFYLNVHALGRLSDVFQAMPALFTQAWLAQRACRVVFGHVAAVRRRPRA